jgi:transposase
LRLVEETLTPEAKITEIARRHDVHPNLLHAWRRQARTGVLAGGGDAKATSSEAVRFAAVAIAPERLAVPAAVASSAGVIEIEFAAGGRMRVTGAVEPSLVSALIKVLVKTKGRR